MAHRSSRSHSREAPMPGGASRRRSPYFRRHHPHHRHPNSKRRLRLPHCWCHPSAARVPFPLQSKEQKPLSQSAVSSAPLFGAPPPGTPRQARNISSYTKTTQQRENGLSVPWVLTKFRRDSARTRQSLFGCIGGFDPYLEASGVFRNGLQKPAMGSRGDFHSALLSAGGRLRRGRVATS